MHSLSITTLYKARTAPKKASRPTPGATMAPALSGGAELEDSEASELPVAFEPEVEVLVASVTLPSLSVEVSTIWVTLPDEPLVPLGPCEPAVVVGLGVPPAETATKAVLVFARKTRIG